MTIVARCDDCNFVGRYNSKYYSIAELQRHVSFDVANVEQDYFSQQECDHPNLKYVEEKN